MAPEAMIGRRSLLAVAAVVDVALHARGKPVAAQALAARLGLAPRHLETLLQDLVRCAILKGTRGPRGGYDLARERRRISVGEIVRLLGTASEAEPAGSRLLAEVVVPALSDATAAFLATLDRLDVESLCRKADGLADAATNKPDDFTI